MGQLIDELAEHRAPERAGRAGVRLRQAERRQVAMEMASLDELLEPDHRARLVWDLVGTFDFQPLLERIAVRDNTSGHPHTDPRILTALWLYGTLDGVGSARALERLCVAHLAYRWICGGVGVNHHTLSDFRVSHADWLDRQLVRGIAGLLLGGQISLETVAQDGLRVRASAAAASFRREKRLREFERLARERVAQLKARLQQPPTAPRRAAAAARAAADRLARVQEALAKLDAERARKRRNGGKPEETRVSTTDAEARVMKMADGGFRPAYNVQFCATADHALVVGVSLGCSGADQDALVPLQAKIARDYGQAPVHVLADGGFVSGAGIEALAAGGSDVHMPLPTGPRAPQGASAAMVAWRARMASAAGQARYRRRGQIIELVNAQVRNCGLYAVTVRGQAKVRAVALWHALAHNMRCLFRRPELRPA